MDTPFATTPVSTDAAAVSYRQMQKVQRGAGLFRGQLSASSGHSTQLDNTPPTVHHDARHPSAVAQVPEVQSLTSRVRFVPSPLPANEPVEMEVTLCSNVANWFQN